ncbi:MAG: hypothetical protein ABMA25_08585 [Ilumatobacteraceae bacterium]
MRQAPCGGALPAKVDVFGADGFIDQAAPDTPAPRLQVVRTWVTPSFTLEARWPADPRELQAPPPPADEIGLLAGWSSTSPDRLTVDVSDPADTVGNTVRSTADFALTLVDNDQLRAMRGPCGQLQLRITRNDGVRETVGVLLAPADGPQIVSLGPLVSEHDTYSSHLAANRTLLCSPDTLASVSAVVEAPSAATPVDALRAFLASELAAAVPRPSLPRPFDETTLDADGTVRYEHFVEWYTFVTITVSPSAEVAGDWQATAWSTGNC